MFLNFLNFWSRKNVLHKCIISHRRINKNEFTCIIFNTCTCITVSKEIHKNNGWICTLYLFKIAPKQYRPACPQSQTRPCVLCLPRVPASDAVWQSLFWTGHLRSIWTSTTLTTQWKLVWKRFRGNSLLWGTHLVQRKHSAFMESSNSCK